MQKRFPLRSIQQQMNSGERPMAKALWSGKVIAESNDCVVVEGNQYFPTEAVKKEYIKDSSHTSICPWKGTAHYYHLDVDGMRNEDAEIGRASCRERG